MKTLLIQRCALLDRLSEHAYQIPSVKEEPNASDLIAGICEFHSFLVEVQTNAGYIHAMHV